MKEEELILNSMIENLDVKEIFELCRKVTEKHLEENNELYEYFHDKSKIAEDDR